MSVYKEGYHYVSIIEEKSVRVYNDACDWGAFTKKDDKIWNVTQQLVKMYGIKETRHETKLKTGSIVLEIDVELVDEWNTGEVEMFHVTFVKPKKKFVHFDGFVTVDKIN